MDRFTSALQAATDGDVYADDLYRHLYSTDASSYQIVPVAVFCPKSQQDVAMAIRTCKQYQIPVISRGGGTSMSGQTIGQGLVIDYSKYMNRVTAHDKENYSLHVQPGAALADVNRFLAPFWQKIGPDPSSAPMATIGGMTGNNSTGTHSIQFGMMADNIEAVEVVLSNGNPLLFEYKTADQIKDILQKATFESQLYKEILRLLEDHRETIKTGYPDTWRNVAGYNLNRLLKTYEADNGLNLADLIVGSEGTLGTITAIRMKTVKKYRSTRLGLVFFDTIRKACDAVPTLLKTGASAIEFTDRLFIQLTDQNPTFGALQRTFIEGDPAAFLIVEYSADRPEDHQPQIDAFYAALEEIGFRGSVRIQSTPEEIDAVWATRKAGFGLMMAKPGDAKPLGFADDGTVPLEHLGDFIEDMQAAFKKEGIEGVFLGHASAGCIHVNPVVNLKKEEGLALMERLAVVMAEIAMKYNGTTSGEHGEGIAKSYFNEQLYGPELHQLFRSVKALFDPDNLMNPGKIIDAPEPWDPSVLRIHPDYDTPLTLSDTHFHYDEVGGFSGLVEMCNGQGFCRKEGGVMCPSYKVTKDERHSTRGRANALRAAIKGELGPEGLSNKALYETLDLCLECKACKKECPSIVDMAKLKYEFLAFYQEKNGVPLKSRLFANIHDINKRSRPFRSIANFTFRNKVFRKFLDLATGIDHRRTIPGLSATNFQQWFDQHEAPQDYPNGKIVLWDDTYLTFNYPEIGIAAVQVLEAAGCQVHLIRNRVCCGRPMVSKGLLKQAKENAATNVQLLLPYVEQGIPVIGLEPSCIATFKDEYPDLLQTDAAAMVAEKSYFIEDFLMELFQQQKLGFNFRSVPPQKIMVHGHCYQKALGDPQKTVDLLRLIPGAIVEEIPSGCCGMAGSFGYEKQHYDVSMACGEETLFPAVRTSSAGTTIAAAGISCRHQIKDGTSKLAKHPIVILANALDQS